MNDPYTDCGPGCKRRDVIGGNPDGREHDECPEGSPEPTQKQQEALNALVAHAWDVNPKPIGAEPTCEHGTGKSEDWHEHFHECLAPDPNNKPVQPKKTWEDETCRYCGQPIRRWAKGTIGENWTHVNAKGQLTSRDCYPHGECSAEPI